MSVLVLFDIDGTLIDPGGSGRAAFDAAFERVYGLARASRGIPFAGCLDSQLFPRVAAHHGLPCEYGRLVQAYLAALPACVAAAPGRVCPGVPELLAELGALAGVAVGLQTGNLRDGARIKLRHFGLWEHFTHGAFAEDATHRAGLVAAAIRRAGGPFDRVAVIGDSADDILAARANGAFAVAVRTGFGDPEAAGPDAALADLADTKEALRVVLGEDLRPLPGKRSR